MFILKLSGDRGTHSRPQGFSQVCHQPPHRADEERTTHQMEVQTTENVKIPFKKKKIKQLPALPPKRRCLFREVPPPAPCHSLVLSSPALPGSCSTQPGTAQPCRPWGSSPSSGKLCNKPSPPLRAASDSCRLVTEHSLSHTPSLRSSRWL